MADRYLRNGISEAEQERLLKARVAVVGCGGLGGRAAEMLARVGIGTIVLIDPDTFSFSNLNRQIFSTPETLGQDKAMVVAAGLKKINPQLDVSACVQPFTAGQLEHVDIVVDGLDSSEARRELARTCRLLEIPMIHGAVERWYGQVGLDFADFKLIDIVYSGGREQESPPVMVMSVALIASLQVAEVVKYLLGIKSSLLNKWLQADLMNCDFVKVDSL